MFFETSIETFENECSIQKDTSKIVYEQCSKLLLDLKNSMRLTVPLTKAQYPTYKSFLRIKRNAGAVIGPTAHLICRDHYTFRIYGVYQEYQIQKLSGDLRRAQNQMLKATNILSGPKHKLEVDHVQSFLNKMEIEQKENQLWLGCDA